MVFRVFLYISLSVFILGLIYKVSTWFVRTTFRVSGQTGACSRFTAFLKGLTGTVFSVKILILLKSLFLDVILQGRTLKEDFLRWVMHMLIYSGFMLLILMHALGEIVTSSVFSNYTSTINPYFFLRDLFGAMVILGVLIAVFRRLLLKSPRFKSSGMDKYAIIIVGIIILSGIFLEGTKITSRSDFMRMTEEYAGLDPESEIDEIRALESLWVKEFGLVSPDVKGPFDEETLELGLEYHEMSCLGCHSPAKWAFTGYITAKVLAPAALFLDRTGAVDILYYIHILSCFLGLALLPFGKMFHIIATPLCLLLNSVTDKDKSLPENIITRQIIELDACVHCGTCTRYCSAMMGYEAQKNPLILPSEKIAALKKYSSGKALGRETFRALQEGIYLCTNCDRCTVVCPSGINLKELWLSLRESIIQENIPEPLMVSPLSLVRGLDRNKLPAGLYTSPLVNTRKALTHNFDTLNTPDDYITLPVPDKADENFVIQDSTYSYCFGCRNCTTVCPVVDNYENPSERLGLLPHQIMRCMGLGLNEMASGPNMLWDCVTCYQCQEHCPQQVKVADIIYDLKNRAKERVDNDKSANSI